MQKKFTYKPSIIAIVFFLRISLPLFFLPLFFLSLFSRVLATIRRCQLVRPSIHWFHLFLIAYFAVLRLAETAPAQPYMTNVALHTGLFSPLLCYLPFFFLFFLHVTVLYCFFFFFNFSNLPHLRRLMVWLPRSIAALLP